MAGAQDADFDLSTRSSARAPIAFALDFPGVDEAKRFVAPLASRLAMVKVGLELFVAEGARAVALGRELDVPVFLDLKLHDIPETVERAVARAAALGAKLLTVHASGGPAMLARAVSRAAKEASGLEIVAVTVLTSLDADDLAQIGFRGEPTEAATRLATLARSTGVTHFVCSPNEATALRAALGPSAVLITPGIRPEGSPASQVPRSPQSEPPRGMRSEPPRALQSEPPRAMRSEPPGPNDQKRVTTPRAAIEAGADVLVVGRPIRDAKDPRAVVEAIAREISLVRAEQAERGAREQIPEGAPRPAKNGPTA